MKSILILVKKKDESKFNWITQTRTKRGTVANQTLLNNETKWEQNPDPNRVSKTMKMEIHTLIPDENGTPCVFIK